MHGYDQIGGRRLVAEVSPPTRDTRQRLVTRIQDRLSGGARFSEALCYTFQSDELLERRQRAEKVRDALEELKPSDREALLLRYEAGLSYREVGEVMATGEATARKRASRALARLRDVLLSSGALR